MTGQPLPQTVRQLLIALSRKQVDIYTELRAQIEKIFSAGLRPTHLDSHKHTHLWLAVFRVVVRLAHEFRIPYVRLPFDAIPPFSRAPFRFARRYYIRLIRDYDVRMADHFLGFRLTGSLTEETLASAIRKLPDGMTEFMCHPGFVGPELLGAHTRLKESRLRELEALTSPRIRQLIAENNVHLDNFSEK